MTFLNKEEKTQPDDKIIIQNMLSKDSTKVWEGSCMICTRSQNREIMLKIVPYLFEIEEAIRGIRSDRFLRRAINILHFYKTSKECPCTLLSEEMNPIELEKEGYVKITEIIYYAGSKQINYYNVVCIACKKIYRVEERQYHYPWWEWVDIGLYSAFE